jgi:hypothetical protein
MTAIIQNGTDLFGVAKWIVNPVSGSGTHTTIGAALTSASSGDTIVITPATYTENPNFKAGVNLTAFGSDDSLNGTGNVIINGTCTFTGAGSVTISGIQLQTNSAALLTVSGSAASVVNLNNCYLNCSNNTGITYSSSSASSAINIYNCTGNLGTTGIGYFTHTSAGILSIKTCNFSNTGLSTTASTISAGTLTLQFSSFINPITSSGTALIGTQWANMDMTTLGNVTALTVGGSGNGNAYFSYFASGSQPAISISSSFSISTCNVVSSNTNAITGTGTLLYNLITMGGTSSLMNTNTLTPFNIDAGGISFDGGTNILSKYTVGTFTPTWLGASVAGTSTYNQQNGYYTRIGGIVQVQCQVVITASTGSGNGTIGALPFTVKNQTNGGCPGSCMFAGSTVWPAGTTSLAFAPAINTTTGVINTSGSTIGSLGTIAIGNTTQIIILNVTYEI